MQSYSDESIVPVTFSANTDYVESRPVYQYDHGLVLKVFGVESISIRQVHFTNTANGLALNILTDLNIDGVVTVPIPDTQLCQNKCIWAYLYFEDDSSGRTIKTVKIPVRPRSKPESVTLDSPIMGPVNQISQELNSLIERVQSVIALNNVSFEINTDDSCLYLNADENLRHAEFSVNLDDGCQYMYTE